MDTREFESALRQTLDDGRLSRTEKQALTARLAELPLNAHRLAELRAAAFDVAGERVLDPAARQVVSWLEELVKLLAAAAPQPVTTPPSRAFFSPGEDCLRAVVGELGRARTSLDVCVFTITDDRIADALLAAHRRGVAVRLVADDQKGEDLGSDIDRLRLGGVPVRLDSSPHHMHHKFAVCDGRRLLNGSYNWTRSAAEHNEENVVLSEEPALLAAFSAQFETLWARFAP